MEETTPAPENTADQTGSVNDQISREEAQETEAQIIAMDQPPEPEMAKIIQEGTPDHAPVEDTPPKNKIFRGEVPYQLTITPENKWDIKYASSITNDIASLAAAKFLMDNAVNSLEARRKYLEEECAKRDDKGGKIKKMSTEFKRYYKQRRDKYAAASFGIGIFLETVQDLYIEKIMNAPKKEEVTNNAQPEAGSESKPEENNQNEAHPHQEPRSDQPTGDSPSGSQHQEERSE